MRSVQLWAQIFRGRGAAAPEVMAAWFGSARDAHDGRWAVDTSGAMPAPVPHSGLAMPASCLREALICYDASSAPSSSWRAGTPASFRGTGPMPSMEANQVRTPVM